MVMQTVIIAQGIRQELEEKGGRGENIRKYSSAKCESMKH